MADRLGAMRGPGESCSDVILRLIEMEGACGPYLGWASSP
jgi:hypothetical protein